MAFGVRARIHDCRNTRCLSRIGRSNIPGWSTFDGWMKPPSRSSLACNYFNQIQRYQLGNSNVFYAATIISILSEMVGEDLGC